MNLQQHAISNFDSLPDSAYVPVAVIADLLNAHVNTVYRMTNRGDLPKPIRFGRATRWQVGQLRASLAKLA